MSGYAPRAITHCDQSAANFPATDTGAAKEAVEEAGPNKYKVRRSSYRSASIGSHSLKVHRAWPMLPVESTWLQQNEPSTLNPQPSTLSPQPSAVNPQPSTLSRQPSTLTKVRPMKALESTFLKQKVLRKEAEAAAALRSQEHDGPDVALIAAQQHGQKALARRQPVRPPTALEAHVLAQGCSLPPPGPRTAPSPLRHQREAAVTPWCLPKAADSAAFAPQGCCPMPPRLCPYTHSRLWPCVCI